MSLVSLLKFITSHPLNQDAKLEAIVRFGKWQLGSRLIDSEIVYEWVNDSKFLVRTGETGLTGNIYTGLHDFPDMGFLLHVLRDDDLFIDIGANSGSYTILACSAVGASGYAFEPIPATFAKLVNNIRLNHLGSRVTCLNVGLGSEKGTIEFTSDMDTVNHVVAQSEKHGNTIAVDLLTLDSVLENEAPTLIKIDVEGYETPVLGGAVETLKKPSLHSVILELNGSGNRYHYDESRILEMMFDHGFKTYSYDPFRRSLTNLNGKNLSSGNTLFIRNEAAVMEKIRNSPLVTVHGKQF
jgi:FkbM family methyltransferase